jgi:hypothetical protein
MSNDIYENISAATKPTIPNRDQKARLADIFSNIPPQSPAETMAHDDMSDEMKELVQAAESEMNGGQNTEGASEPEKTTTPGISTKSEIEPENIGIMDSIFAESIPEIFESGLIMGTEFGYEAAYETQANQLREIGFQIQAQKIKGTLTPAETQEADRIQNIINERLKYYQSRLEGIAQKVSIKEADKKKMGQLLSKIMQASDTHVHPFWALFMMMMTCIITAAMYVGKDWKKYKRVA